MVLDLLQNRHSNAGHNPTRTQSGGCQMNENSVILESLQPFSGRTTESEDDTAFRRLLEALFAAGIDPIEYAIKTRNTRFLARHLKESY